MALRAERLKDDLVESILQRVRERVGRDKVDSTERFVRQFYANVPAADIALMSSERLYGAALALWQYAAARAPRTPLLRVFTPQIDRDSWQSSHSVVEAVTEDMPFLVASLTEALRLEGLSVHLIIHPVIRGRRDADGRLVELYDPARAPADSLAEAIIHLTIDRVTSPDRLEALTARLLGVLADVRAAVEDWRAIRAQLAEAMADLRARSRTGPADEYAEAADFLAWLADDHFTFLGSRVYLFAGEDGQTRLSIPAGGGLGVLRDPELVLFDGLRDLDALPPEVQRFLRALPVLRVTKANRVATVHRAVHMDVVLLREYADDGSVIGERMICGLFTSSAYGAMVRDVPFLRRKVARVIARAGFHPQGHDGRRLTHILGTLPRDELYQITDDELFDISMGVLNLQERQRTALFTRVDPFKRFVSCLVFVPRDRYDTGLRKAVTRLLERAFGGGLSAYYIQVGDDSLARLHVIIRTRPDTLPEFDVRDIEAELIEVARGWPERLRDALVESHGEEDGLALLNRYGDAFPLGYRDGFGAESAVFDIGRIEEVIARGGLGITLYRPLEAEPHQARFKIYHPGEPVPLSDMLPLLENLDLKVITEHPFQVLPAGTAGTIWLHDFETESRTGRPIDAERDKVKFQDAFTRLWTGRIENDGFNRLILRAGLDWREVTILRAFAKYLRQARVQFSQDYMEATLVAHPDVARLIIELFRTRLDPARPEDWSDRSDRLFDAIVLAMEGVTNVDEDQILRRFVNLTLATLRTNWFQDKPHLALKLDSQIIDDLPLPRPLVEVFVYSPRVEAIHLRGGKVARGGIRWSDRREDFRTEILGLMKAQMVKNAVIVPVGSKGGFVVKRPPPAEAGREAAQAEGVECYKTLMRGLLDLTDTLAADGAVVPPEGVVRLDGDDPYLVVAADKGTASFSDIANGVAREYGFWLDDAFASGGSAGYDHKRMAITARGAWESVKRHFRELGRDIQAEDFTCVGVGDMAGDVFGNAMLLSRHIRLLAAFNHQHIFVDPDPDPAASFAERARLAALPRSAWSDYDPARLSAGGAVFARSAKVLTLSPQIRARLAIEAEHITPNELIRTLLRAEVDLLWFGGIGTFVKSHLESHADAGDKANDSLRVDARTLRAKVIGEGANLGMTQLSRVEAAQTHGIRLNTDAIDNSAGVDCSDHEVNIKILLNDVIARGDLTVKQRNQLLSEMTDEVARLVLADNYLQTQALSVVEAAGGERLDAHARFMRALERSGRLNRAVEKLPDDEALLMRAHDRQGLTRPELAVLLAYAKITLYADLLESDLPDDPWMIEDLERYFPEVLRQRFGEAIRRHRLRREIIATSVTNSLVNRVGPTFVREMMEKTGSPPGGIARAYAIARDTFELRSLWREIQDLDGRVPAQCQIAMIHETEVLLERVVGWFLGHGGQPLDIAGEIQAYRPGIEALTVDLAGLLGDGEREALEERVSTLSGQGVPAALAARVAVLPVLAPAVDIVRVAGAAGQPVRAVAAIHYRLGERFGLDWLRRCAGLIHPADHWQEQAVNAIVDDLHGHQIHMTGRVLEASAALPKGADPVEAWSLGRRGAADRLALLLTELRAAPTIDLAKLAVANRQMRALIGV